MISVPPAHLVADAQYKSCCCSREEHLALWSPNAFRLGAWSELFDTRTHLGRTARNARRRGRAAPTTRACPTPSPSTKWSSTTSNGVFPTTRRCTVPDNLEYPEVPRARAGRPKRGTCDTRREQGAVSSVDSGARCRGGRGRGGRGGGLRHQARLLGAWCRTRGTRGGGARRCAEGGWSVVMRGTTNSSRIVLHWE